MSTVTTTIRVSRETRDLLAEQARQRGISLAAMLARIARQINREQTFRAERDAVRRDAASAEVAAEERDWEAALADGID